MRLGDEGHGAPRVVGRASGAATLLLCLLCAREVQSQTPDGAKLYASTCAACHQVSGRGVAGLIPPLAGSEWVTGSEERLVRILLHGIVGEIEVEGETFSGVMPTWGPTLSDEAVAAVATYVRSAWGNAAAPVAVTTVQRIRQLHAERTTPWTVGELRRALRARAPD